MQGIQDRFSLVRADAARFDDHTELALAVEAGLGQEPRSLPCRFFYDAEGSRLFEEICTLPEYYPTRAEREVLQGRARQLALAFAPDHRGPLDLVELGSGNAEKTEVLIRAFLEAGRELRYVPIDICREVLVDSAERLLEDFDELTIQAFAAEYRDGLARLAQLGDAPRLVLCLGSNVGNFDRVAAAEFLGAVRRHLRPVDRLLLGVDLRKEREVLEAAYDDSRGVTARFNKNVLRRIDRELGGQFGEDSFDHQATWDEERGRVDMWLVSERDQTVRVTELERSYDFTRGERIHTESSYKYSIEELETLAQRAGFELQETWLDGLERYSVNLLRPQG